MKKGLKKGEIKVISLDNLQKSGTVTLKNAKVSL
jgi:hypothetical protein